MFTTHITKRMIYHVVRKQSKIFVFKSLHFLVSAFLLSAVSYRFKMKFFELNRTLAKMGTSCYLKRFLPPSAHLDLSSVQMLCLTVLIRVKRLEAGCFSLLVLTMVHQNISTSINVNCKPRLRNWLANLLNFSSPSISIYHGCILTLLYLG